MTEVERPADMNGEVSVSDVHMDLKLEDVPSPVTDSGIGTSENSPVLETAPTATPSPEMPPEGATIKVAQASDNGSATQTLKGPDELAPADSYTSVRRDLPVKLRMGDGSLGRKPVSVPTAFEFTVKQVPGVTALAVKRNNDWVKWTYQQYYDDVILAAKSFIKLGLERYSGVGIIGFNSPEWFISNMAAIYAGGLAVGIYTTNTAEACQYVAHDSQANILVVENHVQLQKILTVRDQLPHLKAIVQYVGELKEKLPDVYTWDQFMLLGKDVPMSAVNERLQQQAPNKCCSLIYTSGTTGAPKGVMLSHDNITWTAHMGIEDAKLKFGEELTITYLPLSHIAAQLMDVYAPAFCGMQVYFAQPDALKGSLATTMKEVRPTLFLGVPRVWEKFQEKMEATAKGATGIKKRIADWAMDIGLRGNLSMMNGQRRKKKRGLVPFGWTIANALLFRKVRAGLGLDRCNFFVSAAAPLRKETIEYLMMLNIPVTEIYGMSECSGPHTFSFPWKYRIGSVGIEMRGAATKLENPDKDGNGEICMLGRHVMMGYLNQEEKTADTFDSDGYLHSGDIGMKDEQGFLHITGRIKELIITAGGENVAPVPIEDKVKEELPCVSNCMLVGDKKKFLSLLITLKTEVDPDTTVPKDNLSRPSLDWCRSLGSDATTVSGILDSKDEKVLKAIQEGIDRANNRSVSRAQKIAKWSILPQDFSIPGEELGPTLKLKRPVVHKKFHNTIEALYEES